MVTLQDGRKESLSIPEGIETAAYLEAFLKGNYPFSEPWVKLNSGEYVRHNFIVSVRPSKN